MAQVKATEVQICIFTWKDLPLVADYPADERAMYNAFAPVVAELRQKHGQNLPVYLEMCPLSIGQNQLIASQLGITDFPGVQVFATYADGSTARYALTKDVQDKLTGVNWTPDDVRGYVEAVLYQREPSDTSILCKIFPPLCNLGGFVWLALAGYSTFRLANAQTTTQKALWGTAAGLTWQSFFAGGGFKKLGIGK